MGCFLACFGSSKDQKRRKQRAKKVQARVQRNASWQAAESIVSLKQDNAEKRIIPVSEIRVKPEEQLSASPRKRVTFDSNVQTYEPVSCNEVTDFTPETEGGKKEEEILAKSRQSQSSSEDSSITSSLGSHPTNHRYQNCRDSDDECEEIGCEESDLDEVEDDDDDDDDEGEVYNDFDGDDDDRIVALRTRISAAQVVTEEVNSSMLTGGLEEREIKSIGTNLNARDRGIYVHPVLNPVENLTQWKAVKAKGGKPPLNPQKENFTLDEEPRISFSSEPSFKELSFNFKSKSDQPRKLNQEIAVDASLSNWLVPSEATPINKTSIAGFDAVIPDRSNSQRSNSPISPEDRPILGALTVEELRKFSASSPRRSPSRSPDEMPIIGTVGTYWSHSSSAKDSTSKYRRAYV